MTQLGAFDHGLVLGIRRKSIEFMFGYKAGIDAVA